MDTNRKNAIFVGLFFLAAMVTSLMGAGFIETIHAAPDYLMTYAKNLSMIRIGVFLELACGIFVIAIPVMMYSRLKKFNENLAVGYLSLRIMEAVAITIGAIVPLLLIPLSHEYLKAGGANLAHIQTISTLLIAVRTHVAAILIPLFFCTSALLFYYFLYKTKSLPRFISIWGFIGVFMIAILNLTEVNIVTGMIFALPIIANEVFLGIWLMAKGFNEPETA